MEDRGKGMNYLVEAIANRGIIGMSKKIRDG